MGKNRFARWDVSDRFERLRVQDCIAKQAHLHFRFLEFLFEILDDLCRREHLRVAHYVGHLTDEIGADVRETCFGEGFAHVAVFSDRAICTACAEAIAEFRELLDGEACVIDDD